MKSQIGLSKKRYFLQQTETLHGQKICGNIGYVKNKTGEVLPK